MTLSRCLSLSGCLFIYLYCMLFINKQFFCITSYLPFVSVCLNTVCSQTQNSDERGDLKTSCPSCFSYHWFICLFICAEMIPTFGVQIYLQLFCVLYCQLYVIFSSSKVCWVLQKCYLELLLEAHSTDKLGPFHHGLLGLNWFPFLCQLPQFVFPLLILSHFWLHYVCLLSEWTLMKLNHITVQQSTALE